MEIRSAWAAADLSAQQDVAARVLTTLDAGRLRRYCPDHPALAQLLDAARLALPQDVPCDVVTMYSLVRLEVKGDPQRRVRAVCYPEDEDAAGGFVSVLSRPGLDLLGLTVGATLPWVLSTGESTTAEVTALLFQPEASGDFEL